MDKMFSKIIKSILTYEYLKFTNIRLTKSLVSNQHHLSFVLIVEL